MKQSSMTFTRVESIQLWHNLKRILMISAEWVNVYGGAVMSVLVDLTKIQIDTTNINTADKCLAKSVKCTEFCSMQLLCLWNTLTSSYLSFSCLGPVHKLLHALSYECLSSSTLCILFCMFVPLLLSAFDAILIFFLPNIFRNAWSNITAEVIGERMETTLLTQTESTKRCIWGWF